MPTIVSYSIIFQMLYLVHASSYLCGNRYQAYLRGEQAQKYYNWNTEENYIAGETNLGRVPVMTIPYHNTFTLHTEVPAL